MLMSLGYALGFTLYKGFFAYEYLYHPLCLVLMAFLLIGEPLNGKSKTTPKLLFVFLAMGMYIIMAFFRTPASKGGCRNIY